MKNLILTLGILLGSLISPSVSAQVIVATMESKVEMQSMGKYDNPVMVTQNIQAFKEKNITYKYEIYLDENYMKIYKDGKYVTDSPFDSYEIVGNGIYYFYSTFTPSAPYNNLIIDDVIIIDQKNNNFYYSWYDPIADVTITQMGKDSDIKFN
tara:strand:- start:758 stop:1216 length:459 start_codon:yes stop_codon:yes gene_type:complete